MFSFTHDHWLEMMTDCSGVPKEFSTASTEQDNECRLTEEEARGEVESQPPHNSTAASPPGEVDTWSYVESEHSHSQASRREGGRSEIQMLLMPPLLCHKDINVCMRPRDSPWPGSCRASVWSTAQLCSSVLTRSDCQTVMVIPPPTHHPNI